MRPPQIFSWWFAENNHTCYSLVISLCPGWYPLLKHDIRGEGKGERGLREILGGVIREYNPQISGSKCHLYQHETFNTDKNNIRTSVVNRVWIT